MESWGVNYDTGSMEDGCLKSWLPPPKPYGVEVVHWPQTVGQAKPQAATTTSESAHITASPQASDSATPMDIDLQKAQPKTQKCYNCQKIRHLVNNCPKSHKQCAQNKYLEKDILDINDHHQSYSHCP